MSEPYNDEEFEKLKEWKEALNKGSFPPFPFPLSNAWENVDRLIAKVESLKYTIALSCNAIAVKQLQEENLNLKHENEALNIIDSEHVEGLKEQNAKLKEQIDYIAPKADIADQIKKLVEGLK